MMEFVWLIPALPLLGFLILSLFNKYIPKSASGYIASAMLLGSFLIVLNLLFSAISGQLIEQPPVVLFHWVHAGNLNLSLSFQIDNLSVWFMSIITGVGFLIHVYSISYMHDDEGVTRYFSYLNLFIFSMLLLVMGSNYVVMFMGWEGVGLCSYLLIGFWFKNQNYNDAAKKAFIMNRIGDLGFLLGMLLIYNQFGTLEYREVFDQASKIINPNEVSTIITVITLLLFVGAMGKSAQIPLYTWLPDAMAGPTPVSALIHAATMVTAGIYMIARSNVLYSMAPCTLDVIYIIGTGTAILAALIGLTQTDIKKVLAYSTVSQLGFMFMAIGLGGYSAGVFHVTTHAFFKALLFLGAGSVIHAMGGEQDIRKMGGLMKKLPITFITFIIATLAIAGIPPLAGFFSKDAILALAFEANPIKWGLGVFAALLTTFYMFRMLYLTFFGEFRGTQHQKEHLHESPLLMTIPLMILAALTVFSGFIEVPHVLGGHNWFSHYLAAANIALPEASHLSNSTEYLLMGTALALVVSVIFITYFLYVSKKTQPASSESEMSFLDKLSYNKFYVDELYDFVIVKPLGFLSDFNSNIIEKHFIDRIVNVSGKSIQWSGKTIRYIQSGDVNTYAIFMVIGIVVILFLNLVL
ncbi:NADH-quinone oxidoreductase subunit L [Cytophaga aurantiaca]|uniref:NADH-quinone oxidoreductase subunit L n=1 Tax=Cytophaga aurantiaca TaxID=29530 RepID=UPI00036AE336|nr:NADH-quinone oxidoreductase subunit L [Cytophaga aurantiaca]